MRSVLVFGASGAVGGFLLPLLAGPHYKVSAASRDERPGWIRGDLNDIHQTWSASEVVISLGPLDAFAAWLERQPATPGRVIALSSMSALSKRESPDPAERELSARLLAAEDRVFAVGRQRQVACTILRPTLIYGAGTDRSLAPIARRMRRWRVLPVPFGATGLRQPVHAADLAKACVAALENPATFGKTYALGGGEQLAFSEMLWRLRAATPGFVLPLPLPLPILRGLASWWPGAAVGRGALARLGEALIADNGPATRDFGYAPSSFKPEDVLPIRA